MIIKDYLVVQVRIGTSLEQHPNAVKVTSSRGDVQCCFVLLKFQKRLKI